MQCNRTFKTSALPLLLSIALLSIALNTSANKPQPNPDDERRTLAFDVFLENKPIGNHQFTLTRPSDADIDVAIAADFKVKVLFVTAFSYLHNNRETWREGCLQSIDASTLVNGKSFEVTGSNTPTGFSLATDSAAKNQPSGQQTTTAACARSFAYWDRSLLNKGLLLNSQTGEFTETTLKPLGASTLRIGSDTLPVTRYSLEGKDVQVTLSYTQSDNQQEEWVGLESTVKGGRTLRYVRTPDSLTASEN